MTNAEIVLTAMELTKLDPIEVEVDTFAGWKRRGFSVKKGETAVFKTKIWKPSKYSKKEIAENEADEKRTKLILVNAAFFTNAQVEKRVEKC